MDAVHFHLLITHLPVFASVLGALVLSYGMISNSRETRIAAYFLLALSAAGAMASNISGEEAEHAVEDLPGVLESLIEEHEESVSLVLWMLIPCGLFSLLGMWASLKKPELEKRLSYLALGLSLVGFLATARTAWLGGQIRHTEIRTSAPASDGLEQEEGSEDEDK